MTINSKLVISPMAGVTDAPFRYMAIKHGADYGISEMITSQTNLWNSNKTQYRLKSHFIENPKIIQIAGASPEKVIEAALASKEAGAGILEINMGCPAKKVCNVLAGSALLRDENLVKSILAAAVSAVDIPIYLKTRLGWSHDNKNIIAIAYIAQEVGISSLAIHGRVRNDFYNGEADYKLIKQVKSLLTIPVFANGDINTPEKAKYVLDYTAADGLYIGRGALGQPWLFSQIKQYLTTGVFHKPESITDILPIIIEHIELIHKHYGDFMGIRFARKHFKWYLQANQDLFTKNDLFSEFSQLETPSEQLSFIAALGLF